MAFCASRADDRPLAASLPVTEAEIVWLIRREAVRHLGDIVLRRTALAITGDIDIAIIASLARIAGRELGWSEEQATLEQSQLITELDVFHGVPREILENRCKEGQNDTSFAQSTPEPSLSERRLP